MLRAAMHYAGAIRLDHVLGLKRLYLVPAGRRPDEGAYVRMPFEPLLALAALESAQHRCIVIGEDLGTVPEGFRDRLREWGLWSYRVMMFERGHDGAFLPPQDYTPDALVRSVHDCRPMKAGAAATTSRSSTGSASIRARAGGAGAGGGAAGARRRRGDGF